MIPERGFSADPTRTDAEVTKGVPCVPSPLTPTLADATSRPLASPAPSSLLRGLSKERLAREIRHYLYRQDYALFAREQLKIRTKEGGEVIPLDIRRRSSQQQWVASTLRQLEEEDFARQIWLKDRQRGGSTCGCSLCAHRCLLNKNTNGLIVAHDKDTAKELFVMVQTFHRYLDPAFRPMVKHDTLEGLVFENPDAKDILTNPGLGSRMFIATARNIHAGVGRTLHAVLLSETARYEKPEELQGAIFDAVPLKNRSIIIMESTAFYNPLTSWFKTICEDTMKGKRYTPWRFVFVPWNQDSDCRIALREGEVLDYTTEERQVMGEFGLTPEQMKWRRYKLGEFQGEVDLFNQSYPLTFEQAWIIPGTGLLTGQTLKDLRAQVREPIFRGSIHAFDPSNGGWFSPEAEGPLSIWEMPDLNEQYDVGTDVCAGVGQTYTVACVLRRRDKVQVAQYRSNTVQPGDELVQILKWLGLAYNTAQIAVEANPGNPGYYTNAELQKIYPNIFIWKHYNKIASRTLSHDTGWDTTPNSKVLLVSTMVDWLSAGKVTIRDETLWKELTTFRKYSDRHYAAIPGEKDDTVMAFAIALRASIDETFEGWGGPPVEIKNETPALEECYYDRNWDKVIRAAEAKDGFGRALAEMEPWQ